MVTVAGGSIWDETSSAEALEGKGFMVGRERFSAGSDGRFVSTSYKMVQKDLRCEGVQSIVPEFQ